MVVEKGYKQTEVGVIPEGWNICEFQDVMTGFSSGQTPYREIKRYYKGDIPWITSGELNYNVITDTVEKITPEAVRKTNLKILPKGTFLFAITGLEAAGTRGSCGITGVEATTNQSCMALYPIRGKLVTEFLYHFYVKNGDLLAFKYCQGTKQQSYTAAIAKKLPIALPSSIKEQTAIANALSDMDALIAQTEKLIEKKKAIKQGVMQELLKPKEGWVTKKLGEVCDGFQNGYGFSATGYSVDGTPIVTMAQIGLDGSFNFDETKVNRWNFEEFNSLKNFHLKNGDLIIAMTDVTPEKNLIGRMSIVCTKEVLLLNQRVGLLRLNPDIVNPYFLMILSNMENWHSYCVASASLGVQANIGTKDILNGQIVIPDIKVQNEIADTLIDLESEIKLKKIKLSKLKHQKQGMMQALLTGKIRLI